MSQDRCSICNHDERDRIEELGEQALNGDASWRGVAREMDLNSHQAIKNHMTKHYALPPTPEEEALASVSDDLRDMVEDLKTAARNAPPEVAPFYAVAIRNLAGIEETKPSQQHLIQALKAIHEVTGMKIEQRLMLDFAKAQFGLGGEEAKGEIEEAREVIDVGEATTSA